MTEEPAAASAGELGSQAAPGRRCFGTLGGSLLVLVIAWAAHLALRPLNDNSFMTHLATGRLILDQGSVPSRDVYSFTARDEAWTVQSWLASVAYAGAERAGGELGVRLLVLIVFATAASLLWFLGSDAPSVVPRILLTSVALVVATEVWSERPYMIGVIGLAIVWLALDGVLPPLVVVPLMWVWANVHGSYPVAVVLVLAVLAGSVLDDRHASGRAHLQVETRVLAAAVVGLLLGAVSPLGLRIFSFPLRSLTNSDRFVEIVEWQAPDFVSTSDRAFLLLAVAGVAAVVHTGRWRHALPVIVFVAAALMSRRNVALAVMVLVPCIAAGLPRVGTLRSSTRPALGSVIMLVSLALLGATVLVGLGNRGVALGGYPTTAVAFTEAAEDAAAREEASAGPRMVTQDFVGNLLEVLDGPDADVFMDDRVDMYPDAVLDDYSTLNDADLGWRSVLSRRNIDRVLWERSHPLASLLVLDRSWRVLYTDSTWLLACHRGTGCGEL